MDSNTRTFTRSRVIALVLVAVAVAGLAYLRFAPDSATVSVPAGARAGQLTLERCTYATEDGKLPADCGTLVVPENRAKPGSRLIALPVKRIRARSGRPGVPVFRLEGGPGQTNMKFPAAHRLAAGRDVVLVGYRGVDGSSVLDCPEVESALERSSDFLGARSMDAQAGAFRACAARLRDEGTDLAGYTLPERVDDFEAARAALGYGRVDLVSESAGTRTALVYAWRHPRSIRRSVMVGVNPPGHFLWNPADSDAQIGRYSALCAQDGTCRRRTVDLEATMRRTAADMPDRWGPFPIREGNVRAASFWGLMEATSESAPLSAPLTLDAWLSAANGDASGFWFQSLMAGMAFPTAQVWGDTAAVARADAVAAERHFAAARGRGSVLGDPGTRFLWAGGRLARAWPAAPGEGRYSRMRDSRVPTLLVSGELDGATPPGVAAREVLPHLPNGRHVVLPGFGHTVDFWGRQPDAGTRLITAWLDRGRVDASLYRRERVDLTPGGTQTMVAKIVAAVMVVLPLTALLSLAWIPWRIRRRGAFGPKASAAARALHPVVLGLGGWLGAVAVLLIADASVPLDGKLIGLASTVPPMALGIYWGWARPERPGRTKLAGLAAAAGGALVGAWLGFEVADGLLALLTTLAGATAGANLALIALDVRLALAARGRRRGVAKSVPAPAPV